jgi:beta-lactam-binding protein with PASTA domain
MNRAAIPKFTLFTICLCLLLGAKGSLNSQTHQATKQPAAVNDRQMQKNTPAKKSSYMFSQRAQVPNLIGATREAAAAKLKETGLTEGEVVQDLSSARPGTVIRQDPAPPAVVPRGTPVRLWLAWAPQNDQSRVPNVIGQTLDRALLMLRRYGFQAGEVTRVPSPQTSETVVQQDPSPGSSAPPRTAVGLWIAVPIPPQIVKVPNLLGLSVAQANAALDTTSLKGVEMGEVPSSSSEGSVIRQEPVAGTEVLPGANVSFWIARSIPPEERPFVRVPNLLRLIEANARRQIAEAQLTTGRVSARASDQPIGTVIDQYPQPGSEVSERSAVNLIIAVAPEVAITKVPRLIGLVRADAAEAVLSANLRLGLVTVISSDARDGTVISQSPAADTTVYPGTQVDLVISASTSILPWAAGGVALLIIAGISYRKMHVPSWVKIGPHADSGAQHFEEGDEGSGASEFTLECSPDPGTQDFADQNPPFSRELDQGGK